MSTVFEFFAAQPVILVFLLLGIGIAVGRVRVGGVSLGAVAVLFAAIGLNAWAVSQGVTLEIPAPIGDLGVAVFAFCTGVIAGPSFFAALKTSWPMMLTVTVILIAAAAAGFGVGAMMGVSPVIVAGTFAGALTNTPALAATGGDTDATVGYASAYVFGVIGAMLAVSFALRLGSGDTDAPVPVVDKQIEVDVDFRPTARDLTSSHGDRITFSRMNPAGGQPVEAVGPETEFEPGDVVNVVGPRDEVDEVTAELGHTSSIDITLDRSRLDFRRIILSNGRLAGRTIASLGLHDRFGANIVRVRRGDVDAVGAPDFELRLGDRLRVVAPTETMPAVSAYLGDSERGLADINPVALGLGVSAGLLLGAVQVPLPGGGSFSLGFAAGALILGLVMGKVGRIGPFVTALPNPAATAIAEFGLLVFLAFAGTKAGSQVVAAIVSGEVLRLLGLGAVMTTIVVVAVFVAARYAFRAGGTRLSGIIGGAQTNPALLGFANSRTDYDVRVALGYSLVYPAAMVVKILLAQVLVGL